MIRVGRCQYENGKRVDPSFPGFTKILVLTASSEFASLSPYCLKNDKGQIMENIYQFQKVYETVPASTQKYSRYDARIIWKWPAERHAIQKEDGSYDILPAYFKWREAGMNAKDAIRYPVGFNHRSKCLFALKEEDDDWKVLDYIQGRKEIYVPLYTELVKQQEQFFELKERLANGENLLIIEIDGAHQESLPYYMDRYHVDEAFIQNSTMLATEENLTIMLNDTKHPYGHGYCLASALLDINTN